MFCANILTVGQGHLATLFGRSNAERFSKVGWVPDSAGSPIIDGVLTWVSCEIEDSRTVGDHHVVIGRVNELGEVRPAAAAADVLPGPVRNPRRAARGGPARAR